MKIRFLREASIILKADDPYYVENVVVVIPETIEEVTRLENYVAEKHAKKEWL